MSTAEEVERAVNKFSGYVSFRLYVCLCVTDYVMRKGKSLSETGEKRETGSCL